MTRRLWLGAVLLCAALQQDCAWTYPPRSPKWTPEHPPPTPGELAALLNSPTRVESTELAFRIRLSHPIVMAGGSIWFSCFVPQSYGPSRLAMVFTGTGYYSERMVESIERTVLLERIPCGHHTALCLVYSARGHERREQKVEARGMGCED